MTTFDFRGNRVFSGGLALGALIVCGLCHSWLAFAVFVVFLVDTQVSLALEIWNDKA